MMMMVDGRWSMMGWDLDPADSVWSRDVASVPEDRVQ